MSEFSRRYGATPQLGGRHVGYGTRNALVGLAGGRYLEIMAPDPEQDVPVERRFFGINAETRTHIVAWCARSGRSLEETVEAGQSAGCELGPIFSMSRARPDGISLAWTLTSPFAKREGGVIPFYIDWGTAPNPATTLACDLGVTAFTIHHPDPDRIRTILAALGETEVAVEAGGDPSLEASFGLP